MENNYDIIKMYFMKDYYATEKICVTQPTIGDIIEYGENDFWSMINLFCTNPTAMRLQLWNNGYDWNKVDDFELFSSLVVNLPKESTEIIFKDLDFSKFKTIRNSDDKLVMVYMPEPTIIIDEEIYKNLVGYLRIMFDIHPKVEKARNNATKEIMIMEDEQNLRIAEENASKQKWNKSLLFPLVSSYLNHPGSKYSSRELEKVGIVEFLDSIKRLQVYENSISLMTGMYMGMVDLSKIDTKKELNWMRDLYE